MKKRLLLVSCLLAISCLSACGDSSESQSVDTTPSNEQSPSSEISTPSTKPTSPQVSTPESSVPSENPSTPEVSTPESSVPSEDSSTPEVSAPESSVPSVDSSIPESSVPSVDSSTPEISTPDVSVPSVTPTYNTITIDEAISLTKQLARGSKSSQSYYIKGVVSEVWNSNYGNFNFGPEDNQFTIYGSYSSDGSVSYSNMSAKINVDDEVVFYGKLYHYYNSSSKTPTKYEVEDAWIMSINNVAVKADGSLEGSSNNNNNNNNNNSSDSSDSSGSTTPINPGVQWTNSDFGNYYQGIDFSNNGTLLSQLQALNKTKRTSLVGYGSMPSKFYETDYDPNDKSKVIGFYTNSSASYSGNMNREHVWPKSHGSAGNLEDDIHMTRPTYSADNSSRGNSFYVEGMKHSSNGWDPKTAGMLEESRGYAARIIFYCVVADSRLSLVDTNYSSTSNANPDYKMGKLSDLLKWNLQYAVDITELNRNNGAQKLQGNRNPFIDNPYLACAIWGNYNDATRKICADYGVIVDPYTGDVTLPETPSVPSNPSEDPSVESSESTLPSTPSVPEVGDGSVYQKVTSNLTDWSGKYLIVYEGGNVALNPTVDNINAAGNTKDITISNNTVAWTQTLENISVTVSKTTGGYTIKTSNNKYLGSTASGSNAITLSTSEICNTITFTSADEITIVSGVGTYLRYNTGWNDVGGFRYYKSSSYSSQKAVQLYKYVAE